MKNILLSLICAAFVLMLSCQQKNSGEDVVYEKYGDSTVSPEGAISASEALQKLEGKDSLNLKIEGKINECCQKKGCWMNIDAGEGREVFVKFLDYAFFVPMNAAGRTAIMEGQLYTDTISVEERKHYAHDKGLSEEEIAAITEPEVSYSFMAKGVILK